MTFFLSMLPIYLLGNLHCAGMCGPLVMMIGQHRYRHWYFFGRALSFSLAGMLAGALGMVINQYHLTGGLSLAIGALIILFSFAILFKRPIPGLHYLKPLSQNISVLMLQDKSWTVFLFGFFTVALPCGQTLIVFSACALYANAWIGFLNGLAFALLTSPSLYFSMQAHHLLSRIKQHYNLAMGICGIIIGSLAICRGLANWEILPHLVLNEDYHLVVF